jgi:myo-inositol-1(or 4)-monophosphatase
MLDREFIVRTAGAIKKAIAPALDDVRWRKPERTAHSGDTSFRLDLLAEDGLAGFLKSQDIPVAAFTEDRGLVRYGEGKPQGLLVVDPIDGTRPALVGLESACISVALAPYGPQPRMRDVYLGCLMEIKGDQVFVGERGKGVVISSSEGDRKPRPSATEDLRRMYWSFEMVGRPPTETMAVLEPLVEASGLEAGMFLLSSATFSISRVIAGRLDAYLDIGARLLRDLPSAREKFLRAGRGRLICLFPYDIAAAVLLAQEAGCCVTDAYGRSMDELLLMEHHEDRLPSCLVAGNEQLHRCIQAVVEERFAELQKASPEKMGAVD